MQGWRNSGQCKWLYNVPLTSDTDPDRPVFICWKWSLIAGWSAVSGYNVQLIILLCYFTRSLSTTLCLRYKPEVLSVAMIALAAKFNNHDLQASSATPGKTWFHSFTKVAESVIEGTWIVFSHWHTIKLFIFINNTYSRTVNKVVFFFLICIWAMVSR